MIRHCPPFRAAEDRAASNVGREQLERAGVVSALTRGI